MKKILSLLSIGVLVVAAAVFGTATPASAAPLTQVNNSGSSSSYIQVQDNYTGGARIVTLYPSWCSYWNNDPSRGCTRGFGMTDVDYVRIPLGCTASVPLANHIVYWGEGWHSWPNYQNATIRVRC